MGMVVVTINILVKHLPLCVEPVLDERLVLLLQEELVEFVEARKIATKNKPIVICDYYLYSLAIKISTCSNFTLEWPIKILKTKNRKKKKKKKKKFENNKQEKKKKKKKKKK